MSHAVKHAEPLFKSPETLAQAFKRLGWDIKRNTTCRAYYSSRKYDYVAVNPEQHGYDFGFIIKDGKIELEADTSMMSQAVWNTLGSNFEKLKQAYSLETISDWTKVHSGTMNETRLANGIIELEIEVDKQNVDLFA